MRNIQPRSLKTLEIDLVVYGEEKINENNNLKNGHSRLLEYIHISLFVGLHKVKVGLCNWKGSKTALLDDLSYNPVHTNQSKKGNNACFFPFVHLMVQANDKPYH